MKIRWNSGSVRLRISPTELAILQRGETVRESLQIGGFGWQAELRSAPVTALHFEGATLRFTLAPQDCAHFYEPTVEGVYFTDEADTTFYVEKDFPCVHPRTAPITDESETFDAPSGFLERKNEE